MRSNNSPREGFLTPDGRLVYSLRYTLESTPPMIRELIVPLDCGGNSRNGLSCPEDPSKRIVNVKPGDAILFKKERIVVTAVEAYQFRSANTHDAGPAYPLPVFEPSHPPKLKTT